MNASIRVALALTLSLGVACTGAVEDGPAPGDVQPASGSTEADAGPPADASPPSPRDAGTNPGKDAAVLDASPPSDAASPTPVLTAVAPNRLPAGAPTPVTLTLRGSAFAPGSYATWSGAPLATTFVSATELTAQVPPASLANVGRFAVKVRTPTPGGGDSAGVEVEVAAELAFIESLVPAQIPAGSPETELVVRGLNFGPIDLVTVDGVRMITTRRSPKEVRVSLRAADLVLGRVVQVGVLRGITPSNAAPLTIAYPAPTVSTIAPSSLAPGSPDTPVTVTGTGFSAVTVVTCDGVDLTTTLVSATQVRATVPASVVAALGSHAVGARNPAPGGGAAAAGTLAVVNPLPTLTRITPSGVPAGAGDTTLTVTGTGFVSTSRITFDGAPLVTRWRSFTALEADLPASAFAAIGMREVGVVTPAPDGGSSTAAVFTVFGDVTCGDSANVDTPLGAPGAAIVKTLDLATAPRARRLSSSGTCPATVSTQSEPRRAYVVQNTVTTPIVLSAWAVCSPGGDAYLTMYRRGAVPSTDAEIRACTGFASEGLSGGGRASPESNGSSWCPGLTKLNGGGLTLAPCEKAVVWIQPYSATSTARPAPATLKLSVDVP